MNWDEIASSLLDEKLFLTALELHTELIENGRESNKLRDFFSNPANFENRQLEIPNSTLPRTSSCQTFDSLDFARYSDDGEHQESDKVAVLEFKLRKAHETLRSLRSVVTKAAETENELLTSPDTLKNFSTENVIEPYEKRAINFLLNEYLLSYDYKLTSVTFCEENENQDFDDWDDVGLNIAKPPNILHIYRDYGHHVTTLIEKNDAFISTDILGEDILQKDILNCHLNQKVSNLEEQIETLRTENEFLLNRIKILESENQKNKFISTSTPTMSPVKSFSKNNETINDSIQANAGSDILDMTNTKHSDDSKQTSWQMSNRKISPIFLEKLCQSAFYIPQDNRIVKEVSSVRNIDDVIPMVARCLPFIVPNVLLNKREEMIPIIIAAASLHNDAKERDKLLHILFNLIKKPDYEQRRIILMGCVAYAKNVSLSRLEEELLPQCWEQIGHKYVERRMLVAEACGALVPYLTNELRGSLIISMLQQLIEDKSEDVRESSIRSFALLVAFIEDSGKFTQAGEILRAALGDKNDSVKKVANELLLPSYGLWALETENLQLVIQTFLDLLQDVIRTALATQAASNSQILPIDDIKFTCWMKALEDIIPLLFCSIISTGPFSKIILEEAEPAKQENRLIDCMVGERSKSACELLQLEVLLSSKYYVYKLINKYDEYISEEWYDPWREFLWVIDDLLPQLLNIVKTISDEVDCVVRHFCSYFRSFCRFFGFKFVDTKIVPKFDIMFNIPKDQLELNIISSHSVYHKCIVPVYTYSILSLFLMNYEKKLSKFLINNICIVAEYDANAQSLYSTFAQLFLDKKVHDLVLGLLWECVVHSSSKVRCLCAKIFEVLLKETSEVNISSKILPALVTLSSDSVMIVRRMTISPLSSIIERVSSKEILDKVYLQLQSFMDDNIYMGEHLLKLELIHCLARIAPNSEPKFRDEFVMPRLAIIAASNNHNSDANRRLEIAMQLFEAYSSLSCCVLEEQVVVECLKPGLVCVQHDLVQVAPERVDIVQSLLRDIDERLLSNARFGQTSITDGSVKSKMFNTLRDIKERSGSSNISKLFSKKT